MAAVAAATHADRDGTTLMPPRIRKCLTLLRDDPTCQASSSRSDRSHANTAPGTER
jgi:hypothetical protein